MNNLQIERLNELADKLYANNSNKIFQYGSVHDNKRILSTVTEIPRIFKEDWTYGSTFKPRMYDSFCSDRGTLGDLRAYFGLTSKEVDDLFFGDPVSSKEEMVLKIQNFVMNKIKDRCGS